jgi:hypothetical protein
LAILGVNENWKNESKNDKLPNGLIRWIKKSENEKDSA